MVRVTLTLRNIQQFKYKILKWAQFPSGTYKNLHNMLRPPLPQNERGSVGNLAIMLPMSCAQMPRTETPPPPKKVLSVDRSTDQDEFI